MSDDLYLMDMAEIQLAATRHKLTDAKKKRLLAARERTLSEVVRVLRPGGRLVITEYGPCPKYHLLWRLWPARILLLRLEPFLDDFWRQDLAAVLGDHAQKHGKKLRQVDGFRCFAGFYRICVFELNGTAV